MITGATPNTVRGWIYRGHIRRNEWELIEPDDLARYLGIDIGTGGCDA